MASLAIPRRSLKGQYLVCKNLMSNIELCNEDLLLWGDCYGIEDGRLDKALKRSGSLRRRVRRCLETIEIELKACPDILDADEEEEDLQNITDYIRDQDATFDVKSSVAEVVQDLVRLSRMLDHPLPSDDLKRMTTSLMGETYTQFDIKYVTDKFPGASLELQRRLGIINRLRRVRIRDTQLAHRTATHLVPENTSTIFVKTADYMDEFDRMSLTDNKMHTPTMTHVWSEASENASTHSTPASVVPSLFEEPVGKVLMGRPNHANSGSKPDSTCTICFESIDPLVSEELWRQHVLDDLEPYVCTMGNCAQSFCTFWCWDDWVTHELAEHHITTIWCCYRCAQNFNTTDNFHSHLRQKHKDKFLEHQLEIITAYSKRLLQRHDFGVQCPLCRAPLRGPMEADAKHIGEHMEEISLFVLQTLTNIHEDDLELGGAEFVSDQVRGTAISSNGSLSNLYAACIQAFDIVMHPSVLDPDIERLSTQLSFSRMRFALWGEAAGLLSNINNKTIIYNPNLDRPDIRSTLEEVLIGMIQHLNHVGPKYDSSTSEMISQSKGLNIFRRAYLRVHSIVSQSLQQEAMEIRVWEDGDFEKLSRIVGLLGRAIQKIERVTKSFIDPTELHNQLRMEVSAISGLESLLIIKNSGIEPPSGATYQISISDTAARCLEFVQSQGDPVQDFSLENESYGKSLSLIKAEDSDYSKREYAIKVYETQRSSNVFAARRILVELRNIWNGDVPFISVQLVDNDIGRLLASIEGPPNTPYAGGIFWITVQMPMDDPFDVPLLKFHTKIYHPNIDVRGNICSDTPAGWNKVLSAGYLSTNTQHEGEEAPSSMDSTLEPRDPRSSFQTWTLSSLLVAICALLA